jgi:uncharacterized Zn finger protein
MPRYYYGFPEYVPVAQKRAKAEKKLKDLRKKNPGIQPVVIEGKSIAHTWWGKSWNENLERYADYSNRIGRGRSYVRHGAVLDLQIKPGKIHGLVQGSQAKPYEVEIAIGKLDKSTWKRVREAAGGQLDSLAELLAGKFPKPLQALFFARDGGLFPSPKEISFDCSCPDWASMCKHVAAVLYGVGARLDESPSLFFDLRGIKVDDLITQAMKRTSQALLKKAGTKTSRVMEDADLTDVFGIKLDDDIGHDTSEGSGKQAAKAAKAAKKSVTRKKRVVAKSTKGKTAQRKSPGKSATQDRESGKLVAKTSTARRKTLAKSVQASTARRKTPAKSARRRTDTARATSASTGRTFVDIVVAAIPQRRKGMGIADICTRVDLNEKQVRSAVTRAVAQGRLTTRGRGVYVRS